MIALTSHLEFFDFEVFYGHLCVLYAPWRAELQS